MVRVGKMRDDIQSSLQAHIRRVYPFVRGPDHWSTRPVQARSAYFESFKLVSEPLIEAIPQYRPGQASRPEDFVSLADNEQEKRRLGGLGQMLQLKDVDFDLYRHQMDSILGALRGDDVVVATGTGSGKTEAFLYPMLNALHDEAIRNKESGEPAQRALKCVVLYPMNALVADQLSRLRDLLGDPKVSTFLHRSGFGRFPQFGMYTGRTPYHGWFSKKEEKEEDGITVTRWKKNGRVSTDVTKFLTNLQNLESRAEAWRALTEKNKLPAIGGKVVLQPDGKEDDLTLLKYHHLSPLAQRMLIEEHGASEIETLKSGMYKLIAEEDRFARFAKDTFGHGAAGSLERDEHKLREPPWMPHIHGLGDCLDRELVARYQMHLGGVRQFVEDNVTNFDLEIGGARMDRTTAIMDHLGVGIPDVMVTNYSMLEYMLMRPLEHVFWDKTKKWLTECSTFGFTEEQQQAKQDEWNLRRRVLLVVDEAHLYKGAMGTEFSLLLNRMLNVLGVERDRLQFIITSASLGEDAASKKEYVQSLLSLDDERMARVKMPGSELVRVPTNAELEQHLKRIGNPIEIIDDAARQHAETAAEELLNAVNRTLDESTKQRLLDLTAQIEQDREQDPTSWPQHRVEDEALKVIFSDDRYEEAVRQSAWITTNDDLKHQHLAYRCVFDWPLALRLKELLLRPEAINQTGREEDVATIDGFYDNLQWFRRKHSGNETVAFTRFPRRYALLRAYLLDEENPIYNPVLDLILDVIATARPSANRSGEPKPGKSFLPLRMHILARGDNAATICPGCGSLHQEGQERCTNQNCEGTDTYRTYELMIERNCGGGFIKLWCEPERPLPQHPNRTKSLRLERDLGGLRWAHQRREQDVGGGDRWLGVVARVLDTNHAIGPDDYWLDLRSGSMVLAKRGDPPQRDGSVRVRVPNKRKSDGREDTRTLREWEIEEGYVHGLKCSYCTRDFKNTQSNQFSNTQTRGDEFFLNTVTTLTTNLDPVPSSSHLPHEGRKTLIFTDSRQGAARLATRFNTAASQDEGRAMLISLHQQRWFQSLNEKHRALDNIYAYLCFFAGLKRMNTLSDVKDMGRTRMLTHAASLASHLLTIHHDKLGMTSLHEEYSTALGDLDKAKERFVQERLRLAAKKILNAAKGPVWKDPNLDKKTMDKRINKLDQIHDTMVITKITAGGHFNRLKDMVSGYGQYFFTEEEWNDLDSDYTQNTDQSIARYEIQSLAKLAKNDDLMLSCLLAESLLRDTERGHLKRTQEVCEATLHALDNNELDGSVFSRSLRSWLNNTLPNLDFRRPPPVLGGHILHWSADRLFGIIPLNLGVLECKIKDRHREDLIDDGAEENTLDKFLTILPMIASDDAALRVKKQSDYVSMARRILGGRLFTKTAQYRSYASSFTYDLPWFVEQDVAEEARELFLDEVLAWYAEQSGNLQRNDPAYIEMKKLIELLKQHDNIVQHLVTPLPNPDNLDQHRIYLNAASIHLKPEGSEHACPTCLAPKPDSMLGAVCLTRGCSDHEHVKIQDNQETREYNAERLAAWKDSVRRLRDPTAVPRIYRAEEHTAQNSERLNREDLYSSTQLYELEFQDIPIQANKVTDGADIEHPPIDILSCSTTMEVGIDIGGLTSVALRNVPPHASNYQQRVGRAGRGSSEVSVALTWVDNTAFATSHFMQPERLVTHPDEAPRIYVKNPVIRRRHFNAICIQRFFKDPDLHPYDDITLTFDGTEHADQLLGSLGTFEEFVTNANPSFGRSDFDAWISNLRREARMVIRGEMAFSTASENLKSICQAMNMQESDLSAICNDLEALRTRISRLGSSQPSGGDESE